MCESTVAVSYPQRCCCARLGYDSEGILEIFYETTTFQLGDEELRDHDLGAQAPAGRHGCV